MALRIDIAGVDLLLPDISYSWKETGGAICEVNGQPQFSHQVAHRTILDKLLKNKGRIPIVGLSSELMSQKMLSGLVEEIHRIGFKLMVVRDLTSFRQALLSPAVDAIVWVITSAPSPWEGMPVDRLDLLIEPTTSPVKDKLHGIEIGENWSIINRNQKKVVFDRLLVFMRDALSTRK
jgi:cyanophycin synthetase